MAYEDDENTAQNSQTNPQGQPQAGAVPETQLSGGGGGFAGQSGAAVGGAQAAPTNSNLGKPTSSGNWTNLNQYLDANADQGQGLGQTIASTVGKTAGQAETDLNNVSTAFQDQAPYQALNNTTGAQVDSAFTNPSQYAPTTNSTGGTTAGASPNTALQYLNDSWNLPTSGITSYGSNTLNADGTVSPWTGTSPTWNTVQNDYTNANQALQNTQSESGRDVLLQNQFGANGMGYNGGEQNFDQLLLQQMPGNSAALNQVYNQYAPNETIAQPTTATGDAATAQNGAATAGVPLDIYNAVNNANTYQTAEAAKGLGFANQAGTDLSNQISGLGTGISGEATAGNTANQAAWQQITNDLGHGGAGATAADIANLNKYGGQNLSLDQNIYNIDPTSGTYLTQGPAYTNSTAATSQDLQNYQGLNSLLAGYSQPTGGTAPSAATDQTNLSGIFGAGGVPLSPNGPINPYSFNGAQFNQAIGSQGSLFNNALQSLDSSQGIANPNETAQQQLKDTQDEGNYLNSLGGGYSQFVPMYQNQAAALQNLINQYQLGNQLGGHNGA